MGAPYRRALAALALTAAPVAGCSTAPLSPRGVVTLAGQPGRIVARNTIPQPAAPATTKVVAEACPAGTTVSGGGIGAALIGGGKPPSSLHVDGIAPAAGGRPAPAGSSPEGWLGVGATGGQLVVGGAVTAYAMCLRGTPFGHAQVVVASAPGPNVAATTSRATASCPAGRRALGGGGLAAAGGGSPSPSLRLIGSYPSDAHGNPAVADPAAWSAVVDAGGRTGTGVHTSAFVLCVPAARLHTVVARASRAGPLGPGSSTPVTVACPRGTELLSGGVQAGPRPGVVPQQGLHLTGSFPATDPESWTARAEAGGQGSPAGTNTTAFAVCLKPA